MTLSQLNSTSLRSQFLSAVLLSLLVFPALFAVNAQSGGGVDQTGT